MQQEFNGKERRRAPRVPICMPSAAECDAWLEACFTKDLSASGAFIISGRLPSISTGFSIDIEMPGEMKRLRLRAVTVRAQGASPRGFGVEWRDVGERERGRLEELWERWKSAFVKRP